jgi:hypothetical protein
MTSQKRLKKQRLKKQGIEKTASTGTQKSARKPRKSVLGARFSVWIAG